MAVEIVNFQITPYSDEVTDRINALNLDELYSIFSRVINPDKLTAALYAIYLQELQAATTCMETLESAYRRDEYLFEQNINQLKLPPNVFVLLVDGIYSGHVYAWTSDTITNVVGLRPSIDQLKDSRCTPEFDIMGPVFLNAIYDWVVEKNPEGDHYLRVLQPVGFLRKVLSDCGFVSAKRYIGQKDFRWMFDNRTIGSTFIARNLLFREWDYIKPLNNAINYSVKSSGLTCPVAQFNYTEIV